MSSLFRIPVRAIPKSHGINEVVLPPSYGYGSIVVEDLARLATLAGEVCSLLANVQRDQDKLRILLSLKGNAAQRLLDSFQLLLDIDALTISSRSILVTALVKLSHKCDMYPQPLDLATVNREEDPFANTGFFEIYKGRLQNRMICLKVVTANTLSIQSKLVKEYFREAVLWSQLAHPNVLPFYGIHRLGDRRNRVAFVSPWMQNGDVHTFLQENPDTSRRHLLLDVACGMAYLHTNSIIHGDLRGNNVLIHDSGRACLADFGMASFRDAYDQQDSAFFSSASASGSVGYQAPELFNHNKNSVRNEATDVYAFGMLCYEMFTGTLPFSEVAPDLALITAVRQGRRPILPSGPRCHLRGFDSSIKKLMQDCWSQYPRKRPSARRIVEYLENNPTSTKGGIGNHFLFDSFLPQRCLYHIFRDGIKGASLD
ncbi:hypothetical protein C0995_009139 [Termitomyces sp. Mi166|nr:hypothetical protein C0995_009139 [Termitomyces sp. Mi166\